MPLNSTFLGIPFLNALTNIDKYVVDSASTRHALRKKVGIIQNDLKCVPLSDMFIDLMNAPDVIKLTFLSEINAHYLLSIEVLLAGGCA